MKHFDLFSGYGGFTIACEKLGVDTIGFSEVDKHAIGVLKYHYPNIQNYGDITAIKWEQIPDFDLLTGGSPCQDFSIAGKRKGLGGARSSLAWEFIRGLRCKKPRYFLWENVKGVMSSRGGWDFANLISAFSESGYALWWQVLNAKDFGVPQNRERIFVFGVRNGNPKEILFERENTKKIEIVGTTIGDNCTRIGERDAVFSRGGVMGSLKATDYKQPPQLLELTRNKSQGYRVYDTEGISTTIASQAGGLGAKTGLYAVLTPDRINKRQNGRRMKTDGEPSFTFNTQDRQGIYDGVSVRRLMPIECERLMGLGDNWTKYGINEKGKYELSDGARYKLCGNGVVVNVVEEIIKKLVK